MFRFKQFTVRDELCGMKVGTDGTLLGAWTTVPVGPCRILDIGTGSGLVALMLAQRCPEAQLTAIDIDADAAKQAADNFLSSPWPDRLTAVQASLQDFESPAPSGTASAGIVATGAAPSGTISGGSAFDLVVSNPPYFVDSLKNPDAARLTARHTDSLSFAELISGSARLLKPGGIAAYVLPADAEQTILHLAAQHHLTPIHITRVHTRNGKPAKRVLLALRKCTADTPSPTEPCTIDSLCLIDDSALAAGLPRSASYQALCGEFYL